MFKLRIILLSFGFGLRVVYPTPIVASNLGKKIRQDEEDKHCIRRKSTPEQTAWTSREYMKKFMNESVHNADNVMSECTVQMSLKEQRTLCP